MTTPAEPDLLPALEERRATLVRACRRALDRWAPPPLAAVRDVRPEVVAFCRDAHRLGVRPPRVRRLVGQAVAGALPPEVVPDRVARWALAAQRLVDEIYLLGEHRPSSGVPR